LGFFAVILLGFLLHNAYFWTRPSQVFAIIAPVNESVWEHLKMAFWALMIYSLAEYTCITGTHLLWMDILSFVVGTALCQTIACNLYRRSPCSRTVRLSSLFYLLLIALLFTLWTYLPPELEIFRDHSSSGANEHAWLGNF